MDESNCVKLWEEITYERFFTFQLAYTGTNVIVVSKALSETISTIQWVLQRAVFQFRAAA